MTLLALKAFLKKAYVWVKNYWYVPIGFLITVITWFFFRQKAEMMVDNFNKTREAHKKEIKVIETAHEKEILSRDKSLNKFIENNKILDKDLAEKIKAVNIKEESREEELANKEIEELATALSDSLSGRKKK